MNDEIVRKYVEGFLTPTFKPIDNVILDNPSPHKGKNARKAICGTGARFFFPLEHSPDPNPIERVFAKLKALMRRRRGTADAIFEVIGERLTRFMPQECESRLGNAGYGSFSR